ncbi:MAG: hypothetical protein MJ128_02035 [Mogibacterium sp.]|nr:hypothetical protein [Mogibacterium sp.]
MLKRKKIRGLAKKTGMPVAKVKRILEECADNAYFMDVKLGKGGAKIYLLVPFAPGIFEFQLARSNEYNESHPEISFLFQRHAFESYGQVAASMPSRPARKLPFRSTVSYGLATA